jgi:CRISPR-associated exonuclease Cas4
MPYAERDFLPISALQHLIYCDRQCALIHLERQWAENRFTAEGAVMHRRAHGGRSETRPAGRVARALPVHSAELGLIGVADVVRWEPDPGSNPSRRPVPVEYKRGRPKPHDADRVQLCAQAICLEEMLGVVVPGGELFYGRTRRRHRVEFDDGLRSATRSTAERLHELISARRTPPAEPGPKCKACSLREICMPDLALRARSVRDYLAHALADGPEIKPS